MNPYIIQFWLKDGGYKIWLRFGTSMENCLAATKTVIAQEYAGRWTGRVSIWAGEVA